MFLIEKLKSLKPLSFLSKALSEQDGTPSLSRYTAFLTTFATIVWVSYLVVHTGTLPDLTSAALFVGAGHGGYAANRISDVLAKDDGTKPPAQA